MAKVVMRDPYDLSAKLIAEHMAFQEAKFQIEMVTGMRKMRFGDPCLEGSGEPINLAGDYRPLRANCRNCGAPGEAVCSYCGTKP